MSEKLNDKYTRGLAKWIANYRFEDTPEEVIERLKLLMLDSIGCGIFGATLPWSKLAVDAITEIDCKGPATVWGTEHKLSPAHATLLNGTFVQGFELDDIHVLGSQHSGATVIPSALSISEHRGGITGEQFLAGIVCGYETVLRVGQCMTGRHTLRGWHPAGTNSPFGAVASVGNIIGLDEEKMVHALGMAGNRGIGLEAVRVSAMDKRMLEGKGSQQGVYSALLAEKGFTGIENIFEAEKGFCRVFSQTKDEFFLEEITKELGKRYDILTTELKAYSANGSTQSPYDCIREIQSKRPFKAEEVDHIKVWTSKLAYEHTNHPYIPKSITYAQFSIPYGVAVMILEGDAFVDQYTEEKIFSPTIVDLAHKVEILEDPEISKLGQLHRHHSRAQVVLKNGEILEAEVEYRRGSRYKPLTKDEIVDKFQKLSSHLMEKSQYEKIRDTMLNLEKIDDVTTLGELLAVPSNK